MSEQSSAGVGIKTARNEASGAAPQGHFPDGSYPPRISVLFKHLQRGGGHREGKRAGPLSLVTGPRSDSVARETRRALGARPELDAS